MGRKSVAVETLHGLTIEDLYTKLNATHDVYEHNILQSVIMRHQGISTPVIAKSLGKCSATIISYIRDWNARGLESIKDNRGGNIPSKLTDEIMKDIKDIIINKTPKDYGYEHSKWTLTLVSTYIADNYGPKYSKAWMSKLMNNLGFSYKRGTFQTTLADESLQKEFKKNDSNNGYS